MASMPILVLPSPLLGGLTWEPAAGVWRDAGRRVVIADLPTRIDTPEDVLADFVARAEQLDGPTLVAHSNAGLYAPEVAARAHAEATVFVDAAIPSVEPETPLAPAKFLRFLTGMADENGLLPPWTEWWPEAELDGLFPDAAWRRRVEATEPRLRLSYFDATLPVPTGWAARPCAYLAFGDTYADELHRAQSYGWPTAQLPGRHLHHLHDQTRVADAVEQLLGGLVTP